MNKDTGELPKGRSWGNIHLHPTHSFLVGAPEARPLTFGVPRGQGHEGAGCSKAGAVEIGVESATVSTEPHLPLQHQSLPSSSPRPGMATSPANQPCGPGAKAVHEDAQWQGGGAEHEGADGEAQVEHLFLAVTAGPPELCILGGVSGVLS